ncbi:MAG: hypothetical protein JW822_03125 [Spirochaetales bacterium]|nr:hypothetical protein [Spirochaetales bacterium]
MKRTIFCIVFLLIMISWVSSQEAVISSYVTSGYLLDQKNSERYRPDKAFDNDPLTSWVEGVSGTGVGSYVGINLSGSVKVDSIGFMPGYFDEKWWRHNNRIKAAEIYLYYSGGEKCIKYQFLDIMQEQRVDLGGTYDLTEVVIMIKSIYAGSQWNDTCLAEISFYYNNSKIKLRNMYNRKYIQYACYRLNDNEYIKQKPLFFHSTTGQKIYSGMRVSESEAVFQKIYGSKFPNEDEIGVNGGSIVSYIKISGGEWSTNLKVGMGSTKYDVLKAYGTKCIENENDNVVIYYYVDSESEYEFVIKFQGQYVTEIQWGPSGP